MVGSKRLEHGNYFIALIFIFSYASIKAYKSHLCVTARQTSWNSKYDKEEDGQDLKENGILKARAGEGEYEHIFLGSNNFLL